MNDDRASKKKKIADAFRALSRGDEVSPSERDLARLWLRRLKGFSKTDADALLFIAECISGRVKLFATVVKDRQVLFIVEKRFKSYVDDRESKRREELFPVVALDVEEHESLIAYQKSRPLFARHEDAKEGVEKMDWSDLAHATKAERANDMRLTKATDFAQFLQGLKARRDKESKLYLTLIEETLRENAKCSRTDLALDKALRDQAMARNPRIRSLIYKKSRSK